MGERASEALQDEDAGGFGPVEVLEQEHERGALAAEELLDGDDEAGLGGVGVDRGGLGDRSAEQGGEVGDGGEEHAGGEVVEVGFEAQRAQGALPYLIRGPAGADGLAAHDPVAADEGDRPQLVEQAGLADAALTADQPQRAAAADGLAERLAQGGELAAAGDEGGGGQEAVAALGALGGRRETDGAGELAGERGEVGLAAQGRAGERALQHAGELAVVAGERGGGRRVGDRRGALVGVAVAEGVGAEEDLVGHHGDRPQVGGLAGGAAPEQLGGHVRDRAGERLAGYGLADAGDAEVEDLDAGVGAVAEDQHVGGREVAVEDAAAVHVGERLEHLQDQSHLLDDGQALAGGLQRARVGQQLHREVGLARGAEAVVEDGDDVRVADRGEGAKLAGEGHERGA